MKFQIFVIFFLEVTKNNYHYVVISRSYHYIVLFIPELLVICIFL